MVFMMRGLMIASVVLTLFGRNCTHESNLDKKAKCATLGRAFIRDLEKTTGGTPRVLSPVFAYNSAADTCLCRYELSWGGNYDDSFLVIDVLSNTTIASFDPVSDVQMPLVKKHYGDTVRAMNEDGELPSALSYTDMIPQAPAPHR
jgi:hypothetical protein